MARPSLIDPSIPSDATPASPGAPRGRPPRAPDRRARPGARRRDARVLHRGVRGHGRLLHPGRELRAPRLGRLGAPGPVPRARLQPRRGDEPAGRVLRAPARGRVGARVPRRRGRSNRGHQGPLRGSGRAAARLHVARRGHELPRTARELHGHRLANALRPGLPRCGGARGSAAARAPSVPARDRALPGRWWQLGHRAGHREAAVERRPPARTVVDRARGDPRDDRVAPVSARLPRRAPRSDRSGTARAATRGASGR